jgi:NAD(P)-dependent dehydrogenase (short-subunit alcohol dehydrogenase family)
LLIVTELRQGIGAAVVQVLLGRGYNVIVTWRSVSKAACSPPSPSRTTPAIEFHHLVAA